MAYVLFLEKKQNEFAVRFSQQSIEMDDFSLEFNNIPKDKFFRGNEHVLRAYLWRKLEEVMLDELQNQQGEFTRRALQNQQHMGIVDITFAKTTYTDINLLKKLNSIWKDREMIQIRLDKYKKMDELSRLNRFLQTRNQKKYEKFNNKYLMIRDIYEEKFSKLKQGDKEKEDEGYNANRQSVLKAFVVFRSSKAKELILEAYRYGACYRRTIKLCSCCCKKRYNRIKLRELNGNWPYPKTPQLPDNIQWQNFGVPNWSIRFRQFISFIFILVTIGTAIYLITFLQQYKEELLNDFITSQECPRGVPKQAAYFDIIQETQMQTGHLHCFCHEVYKHQPSKIDLNFTDVNPDDTFNYCSEWRSKIFWNDLIYLGASLGINVINLVICKVVEVLIDFQKLHSKSEEILGIFRQITYQQYFNLAIVVLLVNFKWKIPLPYFDQIPLLQGEFTEFSVGWYREIGSMICFSLVFNIISPHLPKIFSPLWTCFSRCFDRGFKFQIKASKDDEDGVNTKQVIH